MKNHFFLILTFVLVGYSTLFGQELIVFHTENDPLSIAALDSIGSSFSKENPGVSVKFVTMGWDQLYQQVKLATEGQAPDLIQLEPFMTAALYQQGLLVSLDDVINTLDTSDMFPQILDLQKYDGKRYGIGTALGTSYFAYRKDLFKNSSETLPSSWKEFEEFISSVKDSSGVSPVLLPSNSLHIMILFSELVASNGGNLFDEKGKPQFTSQPVIETLEFWKKLYDATLPQFRNNSYRENFSTFARGGSFTLPAFYGRGTLQFEREAPKDISNQPSVIGLIPHLHGPSGTTGFASLDSEPWAILRNSKNQELAKLFIKFFYRKDNYIKFTSSVPLHLMPIFKSVAESKEYTSQPLVKKYRDFYDYQLKVLLEGRAVPFFMSRFSDNNLSILFELEGKGVIPRMVNGILKDGLTPQQSAERAMLEYQPAVDTSNAFYSVIIVITLLLVLVLVVLVSKRKKQIA